MDVPSRNADTKPMRELLDSKVAEDPSRQTAADTLIEITHVLNASREWALARRYLRAHHPDIAFTDVADYQERERCLEIAVERFEAALRDQQATTPTPGAAQ